MGTTPVIATLRDYATRTTNPSWGQTAALVLRAQEGDREAFGALIQQFERTVYALCLARLNNATEAAELTQEVFLHIMKRLDQLREPERFAGWLRQVAVRMSINRATRRVPPPSVDDEILEDAGGVRHEPIDELIAQERAERLWEGLSRLKPLDRESLVAFYIQGHSLGEIAERLDVPIGTVKRRLHTARKRLKSILEAGSADSDEWSDTRSIHVDEEEADLAVASH